MDQLKPNARDFKAPDERFRSLARQPLSSLDTFPLQLIPPSSSASTSQTAAVSFAETSEIVDSIYELLADKKWLLDADQSMPIPRTSLDDESQPIFSLSDFALQQNAKAAQDVIDSATDAKTGERISASQEQLKELKRDGRMSVPSRNFVDQQHVWETNGAFYLGKTRKRKRFRSGLGRFIDRIVIRVQDAIVGDPDSRSAGRLCPWLFSPSLWGAVTDGFCKAIRHVWKHLQKAMPWSKIEQRPKYESYRVEMILKEAEALYVNHHMRQAVPGYSLESCAQNAHELKSLWEDLGDANWGDAYVPNDVFEEADIRSSSSKAIHERLVEIKRELRERRNEELDIDVDRVMKSPREALMEQRDADDRWLKLEKAEMRNAFGRHDDPRLQAEGSRSFLEHTRQLLTVDDENKRNILENEFSRNLDMRHPILSASALWKGRKLATHSRATIKMQQGDFDLRLRAALDKNDGNTVIVAREILDLRHKFAQDHAPVIKQRLDSKTLPHTPVKIPIYHFLPDEEGKMFHMAEVDYNKHFWRLKFYKEKLFSYVSSLCFGALRTFLAGPLSLRALFSIRPFATNVRRGQEPTPTWISRLRDFYGALRMVLQEFEATPSYSYSILGKSIQRVLLRAMVAIKGALGTVAITGFMVVGTAVVSAMSFATVVLSPVLSLAMVALRVCFDVFVCDFSYPSPKWGVLSIITGFPYFIIVPGILQVALALGTLLLHPIVGSLHLLWSCLRFTWSSLRDAITWPLIRRDAVLPTTDDPLARRIQGPGLASDHLFRISLDHACQAIQVVLDSMRLRSYVEMRKAEISAPLEAFLNIMKTIMLPFGVSLYSCQAFSSSGLYIDIINAYEEDHREEEVSQLSTAGAVSNIWDRTASCLRHSHPGYQNLNTVVPTQDSNPVDFLAHDKSLQKWLRKKKVQDLLSKRKKDDIAGEIVWRSDFLMAKLSLFTNIRLVRLAEAASVPLEMRYKFRLPEDEMQLLWKRTIGQVQEYAEDIKLELLSIAEDSEEKDSLVPVAKRIIERFWTDTGSRPEKNAEIVAAHLISLVFGGDFMLQPIEDIDRHLILIPKIPEEDKHLDFFGMRDENQPDYEIVEPKDVYLDI